MAVHTFAAIDVGSFELELGIYDISSKYGIRAVDHVRHVIALGKDTYHDGKISYELVDEMCNVLADFTEIMKGYKVEDYRACATSAMREARNNQIVLDQIRVRTGIDVTIISNSEQRFISYKAIATRETEFNRIIQKGAATVDVGFGSMQLSLFDKDTLVSTQNLPLGVLRIQGMMTQMRTSPVTRYSMIEEMVDNELYTFKKMYLKERDIKHLIGLGEPILYLFRAAGTVKPDNRISAQTFNAFYEKLLKMPEDQIEEHFGVNAEYASILLPGAIIYKRVLEMTGAEMFWVPGIRLCDGIAADYAEEKKLIRLNHDFTGDILVTARNMAKRYKCHTSHVQAMERYVLRIFDCMKRYHGMGSRERLLLQIAAILHACGKFISMKSTSECAYNIIMATEIIGLSHLEREIVANVVRYNIQEFDYNQVKLDGTADKDVTILIAKLTAILRLANSLDRSHKQKLDDNKMSVKGDNLIVTTTSEEDISLEKMAFDRKVDFFEEIFGIRPILKQKRRV